MGGPWFTLSLGILAGVMIVSYVAVPARLIGAKQSQSRRDRLTTSLVSGVPGATVCLSPYILGRLGLLMLTLQAGATGAVWAIKMSASLTGARQKRGAPSQGT